MFPEKSQSGYDTQEWECATKRCVTAVVVETSPSLQL